MPTIGDTYGPIPNGPARCNGSNFVNASGTNFLAYSKTVVEPLVIEGGCDITVKDVHFVGPDTTGTGSGEAQQDTFITFAGTQTALVDGVKVDGPDGDYVDVQALHEAPGPVQGLYETTNVTIEGSSFRDSGRQGIGFILASKIRLVHDTFYSAAATMFDVEVDSLGGVQADIDISDSEVVGQHYAYLVSAQTGSRLERFQMSGMRLVNGAQMRVWIAPAAGSNNVRVDYNAASAPASWSGGTRPAVFVSSNVTKVAVDHNIVPLLKRYTGGLAKVPNGSIVCESVCPAIHVVGPAIAMLP